MHPSFILESCCYILKIITWLTIMNIKRCFNGKEATANNALDGSTYPG